MNYKNLYDFICYRGKEKRNLDYYEKHHIIPRCMGGDANTCNLTELSAKEHYIVHWLLHKIYPDNWKIAHAFYWMATENGMNKRTISSTQYEKAKKVMANSCSVRNKEQNPMWKKSAKEKISERMKGDNNPSRKYPEKHYLKNGGTGPSKDGKWFNNGTNSRYFKPGEIIPEDWVSGMAPYDDRGKWITNGHDVRRLKMGQEMPEGFKYGKRKI